MRIAYLHYLVDDDTGRHHVRQFAEAAAGLGHEIDVRGMNLAPSGPQDGAGAPPSARLRAALKRRFAWLLHEPKEILWNARYVRAETDLLGTLRPDVLLVRDHLLTASCVPVARRLSLPLVLELNAPADEARLYLREYLHVPGVARAIERYKLRRADAVTVVSSTLKRLLVDTYGLDPGRVAVVPNGADLVRFHPAVRPDPGIRFPPGTSPIIGFVGSFRRWHGTDLMVRMAREVGAARPSAGFLLVGDGPEARAVQEALRPLGARVVLTGRVPHARVPGLTAAFDIGVLPETLFYASPLKVVEWMAAGRSVVAPGYEALGDLVEDGKEAILFRPGDGDDLVRSVLRLVDDPALRARLAAAASARAAQRLSWSENARRVLVACEAARARAAQRAQPPDRSHRPA
ncbi:MAG TPA: glycosyltransferase family 4 protein [Candidatus Polarisedimenticolia bacterium]|nr:glycosyltransferase family 4 protein [Candidatus Polarisedimenticolia bacterium]